MRDLLLYLAFGTLVAACNLIVLTKVFNVEITIAHYLVHIYLMSVFVGVHLFLLKKKNIRGQAFVASFMGVTTAKLLLTMMIIFIYVYLNKEQAKPFGISFAASYLLYTFFSLSLIYNKIRQK